VGEGLELDRQVALKVLLLTPDDEEGRARFQREARVTAQVRHPQVVEVLDFGVDEGSGQAYVVYPLVPGRDLEGEVLALEPLRKVGVALAEALGTPGFMAPEVLRGEPPPRRRPVLPGRHPRGPGRRGRGARGLRAR
jgi:serine/threonine protein kinase